MNTENEVIVTGLSMKQENILTVIFFILAWIICYVLLQYFNIPHYTEKFPFILAFWLPAFAVMFLEKLSERLCSRIFNIANIWMIIYLII